jgi:hypothetical protein
MKANYNVTTNVTDGVITGLSIIHDDAGYTTKSLIESITSDVEERLNKTNLARKIFAVDYLHGVEPIYGCDPYNKIYMLPKVGSVPICSVEQKSIRVNTKKINKSYIVPNTYNALKIGAVQYNAANDLQRSEEVEALKVINASIPMENSMSICGEITPYSLDVAFKLIEVNEYPVDQVIMHINRRKDLQHFGADFLDEAAEFNKKENGIFGYIYGAKIYLTDMCPKNVIYILSWPQIVGVMPITKKLTGISVQYTEAQEWTFEEEVGFCVRNPSATARILLN